MVLKSLTVLSYLVTIATGLAALIGAIHRDSFLYILLAVTYGGFAYWFLLFLAAGALTFEHSQQNGQHIYRLHYSNEIVSLWLLVLAGFVIGLLKLDTSFLFFMAMGFLGIATTTWRATTYLRSRYTKECPDCAETVKRKARVCRFCGYRFEPSEELEVDAREATRGASR